MSNKYENWETLSVKEQTSNYINHVYDKYYNSYLQDSERLERINNRLHLLIVVIGFIDTIILGLQEKILQPCPNLKLSLEIITLSLPSLASVLLLYVTQRGFKKKEELRENARIICKYLVNKAKIDFASCKSDEEYKAIYNWLNDEVQKMQLNQANEYFVSQGDMNK